MNIVLKHSLQQSSLIRIAVTLWSDGDARDLISEFNFSSSVLKNGRGWQRLRDVMINKALELQIPQLLKNELLPFVDEVGFQIMVWRKYHSDLCRASSAMSWLNKLCWTPQGRIDKKRTAEQFVVDENFDIYERYKLACTYCLENYIGVLWRRLEGCKRGNLHHIRLNESPLVLFWSYYIEGIIHELRDMMREYCDDVNVTYYEYAFQLSAVNDNIVATKYFWQKLNPEEKEKCLLKAAKCFVEVKYFLREYKDLIVDHTEMLWFLLSHMNEEQQRQVLKLVPSRVIISLMEWPWLDYVVTIVQRMWGFLREQQYYNILNYIVCDKLNQGFRDESYKELFASLWLLSPYSFRKYAVDECESRGSLFSCLIEAGNAEYIKFIFQDAVLRENLDIILYSAVEKFFLEISWKMTQCFPMLAIQEVLKDGAWSSLGEKVMALNDSCDKILQLLEEEESMSCMNEKVKFRQTNTLPYLIAESGSLKVQCGKLFLFMCERIREFKARKNAKKRNDDAKPLSFIKFIAEEKNAKMDNRSG